eukprot:COSAG02_NODE_864_length_16407_cov_4.535197_5_plen_754_part_00
MNSYSTGHCIPPGVLTLHVRWSHCLAAISTSCRKMLPWKIVTTLWQLEEHAQPTFRALHTILRQTTKPPRHWGTLGGAMIGCGTWIMHNFYLQVFLGGGIFMTSLPLGAAAFAALATRDASGTSPTTGERQSLSINSVTDSTRRPFRAVLMLLLLWVCCVLACSALSPVWNYSFHSYGPATSEFSILPDTPHGDHKYVFKLYTDTVFYYGVLAAFTVLGACVSGKTLRRRMRVPAVAQLGSYHPYPEGATVGELLFVAAVCVMYGWWLWYWRWGYTRILTEGEAAHSLDNKWNGTKNEGGQCCIEFNIPPPANGSSWQRGDAGSCHSRPDTPGIGGTASLHIWARVLGHLTSLSCSLLLLPASKNSAWFEILGVPFERALKYHRGLGLLTYLFVTAHMLLWWIKWAIEGTWWHNLTRPDDLQISPDWHHSDNFTVVVSEIAWLALTFMIGLAVFARRSSYELFYYVHVPVGISFIVAALMHAWTFWYYAVGGLFLWTVDASLRTIRLARAGRGIPIDATFDHRTGVTTLTFEREAFEHHAPAQYVFLCVPSLGLAERHPFTISSPPSAPLRTLHIKALNGGKAGASTFTDKLAQLVGAGGVERLGDVRVDGPYGSAGDLTKSEELVLVAGGIGVTPIISVFAELLALPKQADSGGLLSTPLRRVRLIWVSRTLSELALFANTLHDAAMLQQQKGDTPAVNFEMHLYASAENVSSAETPAAVRMCGESLLKLSSLPPSFLHPALSLARAFWSAL